MQKILVVDDDCEIASLIADSLADEGFTPLIAHDGDTALQMIAADPEIDLIILDIMMPKTDGLEVCRKIRDTITCPIIFVSAKKRIFDTLLGFEMGGDDYITKPFVVEELVARVKAHLRRENRSSNAQKSIIHVGDIEIRRDNYEVLLSGNLVELSTREFQLLLYLSENIGKVLSREQIFNAVWGEDFGDIGTVTVNIKNLRDKLDRGNRYIKTIWGVGYKFVMPTGNPL